MRLGVFVETSRSKGGASALDAIVTEMRSIAGRGFPSIWSPQIFGFDALTAITVAAREVPGVEFGTAVVPIYGRHPMHLFQQALTTQVVAAGRLTLGIGLSHQPVVENMWGYSFDKPARFMREYLEVLGALRTSGAVSVAGESLKAQGNVPIPEGFDLPIVVAALGPTMLSIAGRLAEGTVTWMTGPQTVSDHIAPTISKAAADAGRAAPRVVMALPVAVTDDESAARAKAATAFQVYGFLPSYRAMLDREGASGPADVAIVGTKQHVQDTIRSLEERGATEFVTVPFDNVEATLDAVAELL
ncbi:MAG TPA: TIGR03564 family F420-dependent LLM class oxidoreductase [Acidimicrobiales bacterium]|jgi:5,10-methylenetetrahydromethanopterin reductase|nr:TIGR03564 family F420-dependent LLM class oxidoreductase [Acidimicrobiales bacterium]